MLNNTKLLNHALAVAIATVVAAPLFAACGSTAPVLSGASGQYQSVATMPGALGTNIINHAWVQGNGAAGNADACTTISTGMTAVNGLYRWSASASLNWQAPCATGCNLLKKTTFLTSGMDNNATPRAYFFAASVLAIGSRTQMYDISNGQATTDGVTNCTAGAACVMNKILTPIPTIQTIGNGATYSHPAGTGSVFVSFTLPFGAADVRNFRGYFSAGGQPAADSIVYELYQVNSTAGAAPAAAAANWPGAAIASFTAADCVGAVCSKLVTVTPIASVANNIGYFAIRPFVDGFARTDFLAVLSGGVAGPLAVEGLPTSVAAYSTKVGNLPGVQLRWSSTNESAIAGYNILAANTTTSNFVKVNDRAIALLGPGGTYTQNVTRRTLLSKVGVSKSYLLKLQIVMRDGSTQEVGPATYSFK